MVSEPLPPSPPLPLPSPALSLSSGRRHHQQPYHHPQPHLFLLILPYHHQISPQYSGSRNLSSSSVNRAKGAEPKAFIFLVSLAGWNPEFWISQPSTVRSWCCFLVLIWISSVIRSGSRNLPLFLVYLPKHQRTRRQDLAIEFVTAAVEFAIKKLAVEFVTVAPNIRASSFGIPDFPMHSLFEAKGNQGAPE
ncbi:hypothetical protein Drorol1_Dr00015686 [Drosera rotundifolia]